MSRPLRLEFAGALYHVTSRGDRREAIYEDDPDRHMFLSLFDQLCEAHTGYAIIDAYQSGEYTLEHIRGHFGLHYSTVSAIVRNHKSKT